ncbi:hypothetical protein FSPOR_8118 [Fusarium sporotrichioides]|uniref:Protein kinase domain-containing protein n=1 Tax=Fusarium sporotrichioides TaxID=5514 RepID=A0A395RVW7_FUSSP|nr:hypothetical protein FSPOR_8118 [Fusarium sporotrichioides]
MSSQTSYESAIVDTLTSYQPLRAQRYASINVLIITWKDHDFGSTFDNEIAEVEAVFKETFNHTIWPFKIPTVAAERSLNLCVAKFVKEFGGEDDLLIIFYSGHGGPEIEERSPCTWAANLCGGPTLDWSNIQPQLFSSSGDVAIILDCCYAGQAARPHGSHRVEFLAATDKDNWTPTGMKKYPSFTKVLLREIKDLMSTEGAVTLAALQSRMVVAKSGLKRQPLMVRLAGDISEGPITLVKLVKAGNSEESTHQSDSESINSIYLRLCLFDQLNETPSPRFLRWLTRDSPSSVKDIEIISQAMSQAYKVVKIEEKVFASEIEQGETQTCQSLSREAQAEVQKLTRELKLAVGASCDALSATPGTSKIVLEGLRGASSRLTDFMADLLPTMRRSTLEDLKRSDDVTLKEIRSKISMRLTLLDDDKVTGNSSRVTFCDEPSSGQRIRFGTQSTQDVLVEYVYYDKENDDDYKKVSYQIRRMMALLAESQNSIFRTLSTSGFIHERLPSPRFGIVHPLTGDLKGRKFISLDQLMKEIKYVTLERRMGLAADICEAILHLHSVGWYHKNIKNSNIIIPTSLNNGEATKHETEWDFDNPFIIGFDCSRPANAETANTVDFDTTANLYRHPSRWGRSTRFEKHHDIYSLGILILEIGCWLHVTALDTKKGYFERIRDPEDLRTLLLKVASSKLAHAAGTRYAEAVRNCIMKRKWEGLEDWKSQKLVREGVLDLLRSYLGKNG